LSKNAATLRINGENDVINAYVVALTSDERSSPSELDAHVG